MIQPCAHCPCPDTCLGWPAFCAWAAEDPSDETRIRHIRVRSGRRMDEVWGTGTGRSGEAPDPRTPASETAEKRPAVSEVIGRIRTMKACQFRSVGPGCGCSGALCALRRGTAVSYNDCMDCVQRYPEP